MINLIANFLVNSASGDLTAFQPFRRLKIACEVHREPVAEQQDYFAASGCDNPGAAMNFASSLPSS